LPGSCGTTKASSSPPRLARRSSRALCAGCSLASPKLPA
jgi:hypothetical protein